MELLEVFLLIRLGHFIPSVISVLNRMAPEGWLIEPSNHWLLLFHEDPSAWVDEPSFYMDKWSVSSTGTPYSFVSRRKVHLISALETWNELQDNGWIKVGATFA